MSRAPARRTSPPSVAKVSPSDHAFAEVASGAPAVPPARLEVDVVAQTDLQLLALLPVGLCDDFVCVDAPQDHHAPVTLLAVLELCDLFAQRVAAGGDRVVRGGFFDVAASHTSDLALRYALNNPFEPCFALCHLHAPSGFDPAGLSVGGQTIFLEPNAGGSSVASEVLAFEALRCLLGAQLHRTEMQIAYWSWFSKKTDFACRIEGQVYGVSVARCFDWRAAGAGASVSREEAERLLVKKLDGVNKCNAEVCAQDRWAKQFLFLWVRSNADAQTLHDVYVNSERVADVRGNTIVLVCVCDDEFVYSNQCAAGVHAPSAVAGAPRDISAECAPAFFDVSVFPFYQSVHVY